MRDKTLNRFKTHCIFWTPVITTMSLITVMSAAMGASVGLGSYYVIALQAADPVWDIVNAITAGSLLGLAVAGCFGYPLYRMYYEHVFECPVITRELVKYTDREVRIIVEQYTLLYRPEYNLLGTEAERKAYIKHTTKNAINQRDTDPENGKYWQHNVRVQHDYTRYQHYIDTLSAT